MNNAVGYMIAAESTSYQKQLESSLTPSEAAALATIFVDASSVCKQCHGPAMQAATYVIHTMFFCRPIIACVFV
jgi:hypothetical protein